jgi:ectoine hydroxylase
LFYEMMAADAFPVMGAMTKFDSIEDYNSRLLCGAPTLTPRLTDVPIRIPQPQPAKAGSIYEIQAGLAARAFDKI